MDQGGNWTDFLHPVPSLTLPSSVIDSREWNISSITPPAIDLAESMAPSSSERTNSDKSRYEEEVLLYFKNLSYLVAFWVNRAVVPLVTMFGVVGNLVTIRLLSKRKMVEGPTHVYLTGLASADLLYLIFMSTLSFTHYPNVHQKSYILYWMYRPYGLWLTDSSSKLLDYNN